MKNLFKSALVILIGLSSCQEDSLNQSVDPRQAEATNLREAAISPIPQKYQLIKHGDNKLSYTQDGKLQKVTYGVTKRGAFSTYITYKYGFQTISSTLYYDNKIAQTSIYLLDDKGRCVESKQLERIPYGQNAYVEKESNFTYQYNVKGQLVTRINKKAISEKTLFTWNIDGDMDAIMGYYYQNGHAYESTPGVANILYDQPVGQILSTDLRPINPEIASLPDPYLMIFGKPSKHLVKYIIDQVPVISNRMLFYTLNADGYVLNREIWGQSGSTLLETKSYEYLVTDLGLNL